jgi:hypothetical protein
VESGVCEEIRTIVVAFATLAGKRTPVRLGVPVSKWQLERVPRLVGRKGAVRLQSRILCVWVEFVDRLICFAPRLLGSLLKGGDCNGHGEERYSCSCLAAWLLGCLTDRWSVLCGTTINSRSMCSEPVNLFNTKP